MFDVRKKFGINVLIAEYPGIIIIYFFSVYIDKKNVFYLIKNN